MKAGVWCKAGVLGCVVFLMGCMSGGNRQAGVGAYDQIYTMSDIQMRWANWENPLAEKGAGGKANSGRKGSPTGPLGAGESKVIAQAKDQSGTIRRIWMTMSDRSPLMMRGLRLEFYWDGADKPAISAPIGDFFCQGLGQMITFESALFSNPEGRNFMSYIPMPFRKGMKVVVTNDTAVDLHQFWYQIDYTLGDPHGKDMLYLHAHWRRENPTTRQQDYEILPFLEGRGRYLGANIGVIVNQEDYLTSWWGEGEVKIYLDGDGAYPTLCGTGAEDYIGTSWGLSAFSNLYQGCPLASEKQRFFIYRFHLPDPVYFQNDIRVTIQQIGFLSLQEREKFIEKGLIPYTTGAGLKPIDLEQPWPHLFERHDDYSSCAYFYLDRPVNNLPAVAPLEKRIEGLE